MPSRADNVSAIRAAQAFAPRAREVYPHAAVYLFGSYAKGCQTEASDIDVAVILPDYGELTPAQILDRDTALWAAAGDIDDRIEPCVRTMDDTTGFVRSIIETGIPVS